MRKAFTIIEVMIAVFLALIISTVAFSITGNAKKMFVLIDKRKIFYLKSSVMAIEEKNTKNVYEILKDFNIKNDEIIKKLKKDTFYLKHNIEYSQNINIHGKSIKILLDRMKIYNKYHSAFIYKQEIK
ncbi:prepilin-type N-terminal cleavage/methylation domain protein [Nautilia profundicola AmH]|uniref:Prepilin-type N-terminal cleavage/methylation domain protein n=1 Tax=Nautilia profundicola (strain ATCC BAA-1463 / DSM 18972 / AmH) TaxID=598659 RepID=B9L750_NAUPA|nr:prepilin-type N-terminal cleavage/methylation domain-containing protein [Nautilia profundicola]ACM93261.1 prepilin-type N-terminal cleavage/methylation domain protein [Nautilia profundicola AmH]